MKKFSLVLLCMLLSLSSVSMMSCSGNSGKDDKLVGQKLQIPEHFKLIPADSPYVMADIEPFPYDKIGKTFMDSYAPFLSQLREQMVRDYQDVPPEMLNKETRMMMAVLDELDGNLSPEGLKKLGLDMQGHISIYGLGAWPVLRMSLSDSKKLEALFKRIEAKVGESLPKKTFEGVELREVGDAEVALPIIITDDALIVGFTSRAFYDQYMKLALGKVKPAKSMFEDNRLLAMQQRNGFKPYMSGTFDAQAIVTALIGGSPDSLLAKSFAGIPNFPPPLSADCKAEYLELTKHAPRMAFGYRDVTRNALKASFITESATDMPARMTELKGAIPGYGSDLFKGAVGWAGSGVNLKAMSSFLSAQADRMRQAPYKCEHLQNMNQMADTFATASTGIPNYIQAITGASFVVSKVDVDIQNRKIGTLDVALMIRTGDPQGLFQTLKAQAPMPEIQSLNPSPDGQPVPVQLPDMIKMSVPDMPTPYVIMTKDGLAVALGQSMAERVASTMKATPAKTTPMMAVSYDMMAIAKIIEKNVPMDTMDATERMTYETMMNTYKDFGPVLMSFDVKPKTYMVDTDMVILNTPAK